MGRACGDLHNTRHRREPKNTGFCVFACRVVQERHKHLQSAVGKTSIMNVIRVLAEAERGLGSCCCGEGARTFFVAACQGFRNVAIDWYEEFFFHSSNRTSVRQHLTTAYQRLDEWSWIRQAQHSTRLLQSFSFWPQFSFPTPTQRQQRVGFKHLHRWGGWESLASLISVLDISNPVFLSLTIFSH